MGKYSPFIIFLLLLWGSWLYGQQPLPDSIEQEIARRIGLEINPSISIGLLLPSGETVFYNYSYRDPDQQMPNNEFTPYEVGSITKTFTATLADKYLTSSDFQSDLPAVFQNDHIAQLDRVSVRSLQNHTSGLPRLSEQFEPEDWSNPFKGYSRNQHIKELKQVQPDTTNRWAYSNFGYATLGAVIEHQTGQSFPGLMEGLFKDAGMSNSYLSHPANMPTPTNRGTKNSYWTFDGPSRYAGGLISCTSDLAAYLQYQIGENRMFREKPVEHLISTGINDFGEGRLYYKEGWFILKPDSGTEILIHNGVTGGFTGFIGYNKSTGTGVVMLSNAPALVDDIGLALIYPGFEMSHPERTAVYELADQIDAGNTDQLLTEYQNLTINGFQEDIMGVYWLERYYYGKGYYDISNQLSSIMVEALPDDFEVMDIKGQNLEALHRFRDATRAYEAALELAPNNSVIEEKIARCKALAYPLEGKQQKTYDILIDTDLGGDPDDIQSLFRAIHYSDLLKIKGIVSTPNSSKDWHPWDTIPNTELIREWIKRVDVEHLRQKGYTNLMREADLLSVVKAGSMTPGAPSHKKSSTGANWIIETARQYSREKPLWVLVWGSMTTVAQALYEAPDIAERIRIYCIGSTNTQHDPASRDYVYEFMEEQYPELWWIENGQLPKGSHETFRGVYQSGDQEGEWAYTQFIGANIRGHGSDHNGLFAERCGDVFPVAHYPKNSLKEGDSPSLLYLVSPVLGKVGDVDDPTQESWGGQFRHFDAQAFPNYYVDLDQSPEACQRTIGKWRKAILMDWKYRWDRYDEND